MATEPAGLEAPLTDEPQPVDNSTTGRSLLGKADAANQARRDACPNRDAHATDEPTGYLAWHAWAKSKSKTHRQRKCPGCDLWLIWEPR